MKGSEIKGNLNKDTIGDLRLKRRASEMGGPRHITIQNTSSPEGRSSHPRPREKHHNGYFSNFNNYRSNRMKSSATAYMASISPDGKIRRSYSPMLSRITRELPF